MRGRSVLSFVLLSACAEPGGPGAASAVVRTPIVAGWFSTCGVAASGGAYCWGHGTEAGVGDGTTASRTAPTRVAGAADAAAVSARHDHGCALTPAGEAYCWGRNYFGELGFVPTAERFHPVPRRVETSLRFVQIGTNGNHTCALTAAGAAWCWGANVLGQLGDGSQTQRWAPELVAGGHRFTQLTVGVLHTCALDADGRAWCWGDSGDHSGGAAVDRRTRTVPTLMSSELRFERIEGRGRHTLAIAVDGAAWGWGDNSAAQLGDGTTEYRGAPVRVASALRWSRLAAGLWHSCGLTTAGEPHCWGQGYLGTETSQWPIPPRPVLGGRRFREISAGWTHTAAVDSAGAAWVWGSSAGPGTLGPGEATTSVLAPARVLGGLVFR